MTTIVTALALVLLIASGPGSAPVAQNDALAPPGEHPQPGERVWLGVWLGDAMDGGVQIVALVRDGPAQRAGLLVGDVIVRVGERAVSNQDVLGSLLEVRRPGDEVELSLLRSGRVERTKVVLGQRPTERSVPAPPELVAPRLPDRFGVGPRDRLESRWAAGLAGLEVAEITPALRVHYGAPRDAGVLVLAVARSEDEEVVLEVGDVLVRLAGQAIQGRRQLERRLSTWSWDAPLQAQVVRAGQPLELIIAAPAGLREAKTRVQRERRTVEREIIESRINSEIERLNRRIEELHEQLERLNGDE